MSANTPSSRQEKETLRQGKVFLPDRERLSPQERLRLDTAVMLLVDYLLAASERNQSKSS